MSLAVERESSSLGGSGEGSYWETTGSGAPRKHEHVTVIGAGIVGLATAAALVRSGRAVTVIDELQGPGHGTSWGNGCQLSYGYVAPLANEGLWSELSHLLCSSDSPLKIRLRLDPGQWSWMLSFLQACNARRSRQSTTELLELAKLSRQETERWLAMVEPSVLSYTCYGKVVVLPTEAALAKAMHQMKLQEGLGPVQHALTEEECLRLEPALQRFRGKMAGAIHTPSECAVDSLALCRNLEQQLRARGVEFRYATKVLGFERAAGDSHRVAAVVSDQGRLAVDGMVLAAGVGSRAIARMLGFSVPVYPMKGYSITGRILDPEAVPRASITDAAKKVVYARIGSRLRVAGFAELQGYDRALDTAKIEALVQYTHEAFGSAVEMEPDSAWAGLRPVTPTSVPIIRQSPVSNMFLNIGQGALGLTLAFGSARRLVELIEAR